MYEVEVKVSAALATVRDRLEALDADRRRTVVQTDTYYDAPHREFAETDEALRIRRESTPESDGDGGGDGDGEKVEENGENEAETTESRITYKGPLLDDESKSREEFETDVADGETMDAVLTNLGFAAVATVRKERERYGLEHAGYGYTVTLDSVDDVGEYVEVETDVAREADLEAAREGAYAVLEELGLDPDDQLRTSYLGLLLES